MLYYQQKGTGKKIIFFHGSSQSSEVWENLINEPALAAYTLLTIDLPGHGNSPRSTEPEKDYTLKGIAAILKDFLEKNEGDYIIVANSIATNLIAEIVSELTNCKGLFLTGSSVIGKGFTLGDIVKPSPYFAATFTADPDNEEVEGLIKTWTVQMDIASQSRYVKTFRATDPAFRTQMGIAVSNGEWSDEVASLEGLKYPVAVICGAEEKIVYPDYLNRSDINLWKGSAIQIPGAGHSCQLDKPAELAELINEYAGLIFRSGGS